MFEYPKEMSDIEKWVYLKELESKIKLELKVVGENVNSELEELGGFSRTETGSVQQVKRITSKPKDELKFFLQEKGVLDICKKDEIDLSKVKELIECGVLDNEEVESHLEITETSYLKFRQAKIEEDE